MTMRASYPEHAIDSANHKQDVQWDAEARAVGRAAGQDTDSADRDDDQKGCALGGVQSAVEERKAERPEHQESEMRSAHCKDQGTASRSQRCWTKNQGRLQGAQ